MGNTLTPKSCSAAEPDNLFYGDDGIALHNLSVLGIDASLGTLTDVTATSATVPLTINGLGYFGGLNFSLRYRVHNDTTPNAWSDLAAGYTQVLSSETFPFTINFANVPYADDGTEYDYAVMVSTGTGVGQVSGVPGKTVVYSEAAPQTEIWVADIDFGGDNATDWPSGVSGITISNTSLASGSAQTSIVDNDGTDTGATIAVTSAFTGSSPLGTEPGDDKALYNKQMGDYGYTDASSVAEVTLTVPASGVYRLRISASRASTSSDLKETLVTIGGQTDTFNASTAASGPNVDDYAEITFTVTNAALPIPITIQANTGSENGYAGGMRLTRLS